jgi:hypothetical protein
MKKLCRLIRYRYCWANVVVLELRKCPAQRPVAILRAAYEGAVEMKLYKISPNHICFRARTPLPNRNFARLSLSNGRTIV